MLTEGIWDRTGQSEMSQSSYVRAIAFFTLLVGFVVALGAVMSYNWTPSWLLLLGSFGVSVVCIFVFQMNDNPAISAIGVSGMSFALGLMLGPVVALYPDLVVMQAIVTTAAVMVVMSIIGIVVPKTFEGWGPYLMGGLTLLIVAQFGQLILMAMGFPQAGNMPLVTWGGIVLFIAIVAFDWSRALDLPYTLDNAIDASGGLILDAVNLFIRILQIYGNRGSSSRR